MGPAKMYASEDSTISRQKGELTAPQYVPMKRGCVSRTCPFADGIVAYAYPEASTNFWNAALAFPSRNLGPPTNTGFTDSFRNFTAASTAASRDSWLLVLQQKNKEEEEEEEEIIKKKSWTSGVLNLSSPISSFVSQIFLLC
jgi:hypothetical protein